MWWNNYALQMSNIWGYQFNTSWTLVFYVYIHECTNSKDIGSNMEKEMSAKQGIISSHRCERTNMAAKCDNFVNWSKIFIGTCKKQI